MGENITASSTMSLLKRALVMTPERRATSRMDHIGIKDFQQRCSTGLSGTPTQDFKGISEGTPVKGNTWDIIREAYDADDADELEGLLKSNHGVAPAWAATVAHQIVEGLAKGIKMP